jgi:hypothetical protein
VIGVVEPVGLVVVATGFDGVEVATGFVVVLVDPGCRS